MGSTLTKLTGFASRSAFSMALGDLTNLTPLTVSTESIHIFTIIITPQALSSPVKMTDKDDNILSRWYIEADSWFVLEIPFLAQNGLKISVDEGLGGNAVSGFITRVGVFYSHSSA